MQFYHCYINFMAANTFSTQLPPFQISSTFFTWFIPEGYLYLKLRDNKVNNSSKNLEMNGG